MPLRIFSISEIGFRLKVPENERHCVEQAPFQELSVELLLPTRRPKPNHHPQEGEGLVPQNVPNLENPTASNPKTQLKPLKSHPALAGGGEGEGGSTFNY